MLQQVFVYGTLRQGGLYRPRIEPFVERSRPGWIRARMYHFAPRGSRGRWPYIVAGDDAVRGELLELRLFDTALGVLDRIEDYPRLYDRRETAVWLDEAPEHPVTALVYWIVPEAAQEGRYIASGDWTAETPAD